MLYKSGHVTSHSSGPQVAHSSKRQMNIVLSEQMGEQLIWLRLKMSFR